MGLFQNYQLFDIVIVAAAVAIIAGAISILLWVYTLFRAAIQFSWWIIELFPTTISNAHTLHKISNKNRNNRLQDSVESFCKRILKLCTRMHKPICICMNYLFLSNFVHHLDVRTWMQNQSIVYINVFLVICSRFRYVKWWCPIEVRCDCCAQVLQGCRRSRWK